MEQYIEEKKHKKFFMEQCIKLNLKTFTLDNVLEKIKNFYMEQYMKNNLKTLTWNNIWKKT